MCVACVVRVLCVCCACACVALTIPVVASRHPRIECEVFAFAAVDAQAVDRAYRIGQTKDVVTYRLISCGSVEEKMYRLQVFKVTRTVMS